MRVGPGSKIGFNPLFCSAFANFRRVGTANVLVECRAHGSFDLCRIAVILAHDKTLEKVVAWHDPIHPTVIGNEAGREIRNWYTDHYLSGQTLP